MQHSEDCLFLNVYRRTPTSSTVSTSSESSIHTPTSSLSNTGSSSSAALSSSNLGLLPVLLFIHGGCYANGAASFVIYDAGERVALANSSTIVVTINYRLNVFGFLGGDTLRGDDNSTGNWGLQDQRAAMMWVRDSIQAFGGDPDRVTVFGESAGSGSVSNHIVMPKSAGTRTNRP